MESDVFCRSESVPKIVKNNDRCAYCDAVRSKWPEKKFFRFPKDPETSSKWISASKLGFLQAIPPEELYKKYRLCSDHFSPKDYASQKMHRLVSNACPSQFDIRENSNHQSCIDIQSIKESLQVKLMSTPLEETTNSNKLCTPSPVLTSTPKRACENTYNESNDRCKRIRLASPLRSDTNVEAGSVQSDVLSSLPNFATPKRKRFRKVVTPKTQKIKILSTKLYYATRKMLKVDRPSQEVQVHLLLKKIKCLVKPVIYQFIASQLKSSNISAYGRRYNVQDKNLALKLYLASPRSYAVLSKYFYFPSKRTLQKSIAGIDVQPGFMPSVLNSLKLITSKMKPQDRLCIISFDEMKVDSGLAYHVKKDCIIGYENYGPTSTLKLATHALVFMVRGICKKWKQVFGTFFSADTTSSETLKSLLFEAVEKLEDCGLQPIATVCDQGSNNQKLYSELGVSEENPYFYVCNTKLFSLFDPPHLLKCLRNNFAKYNVIFNETKTASWSHIISLWEFDSQMTHRVVKKLTSKHIFLTGFSKMSVKLATQVLSNSVGAALCYLASLQRLPSSAHDTADFCVKVDGLFDSVNSRVLRHKTKPLLSAATSTSQHISAWKDFLEFIKSIEFQTHGKKIKFPCLHGWKLTLSALLQLLPEMFKKIPFVLLSRFNQDALENFFSQVRRKGGSNDHPTPLDFLYRVRLLLAEDIFSMCGNANCEPDNDVVLLPVDILPTNSINVTIDEVSVFNMDEQSLHGIEGQNSQDIDDPNLLDIDEPGTLYEQNSAAYVAGYIAKKAVEKFTCELCHSLLTKEKNLSNSTVFLNFKEYDGVKYGLQYPSDLFIDTIYRFGKQFSTSFEFMCNKPNIKERLSYELINFNHTWLTCAEHVDDIWAFIVYFYVKIMIFNKVKSISKDIRSRRKTTKKLNKF